MAVERLLVKTGVDCRFAKRLGGVRRGRAEVARAIVPALEGSRLERGLPGERDAVALRRFGVTSRAKRPLRFDRP
jgi:hypothetical protein